MDFMITCVPSYLIKKTKKDIDEASDTYDTIDWLVKIRQIIMVMLGCGDFISRILLDLFLISNHPTLKAVSPQACISDFFDDFHHNGAYLLSYWKATPLFGIQKQNAQQRLGIKCQIWGLKTITNFF
jgi:predicted acyl esterase